MTPDVQQTTSSLKQRLVSQALKEPLFGAALRDAAEEIVLGSKDAPNEATIESLFERVLYAVLKEIGISFHPKKELPISTRRHTAKGRTDSRIGALVIEYKQPSTLSSKTAIDKAVDQLLAYLQSIVNEMDNEAVGYLTDGTKLREIRVGNSGAITDSGFSPLSEKVLLRLTRSIVSLEQSALTAKNLIRDFCGDGHSGIVFHLARELNQILGYHSTIKTEMLRTEWEELFRLAHEDQSLQKRIQDRRKVLSEIFGVSISEATMEYRALFSLHTAYAIILKLIAYRVVSDVKFKTVLQDYKSLINANPDVLRAFCATLEDGELFRQIGILNLLEGDFFSWYSDKKQWNTAISSGVQEVIQTLARYEDVKAIFDDVHAVDLFRSLYEATVPQVVRASFGEFYTPYWLAEHVISTGNLSPGWTALDPCCGSGTFLIAAIGKIRQQEGVKASGRDILHRISGIDLNPLAVLTARIHYFIHIADLLEDDEDEFVIPVFLGDASNVPIIREEEGVEFFYYELKTLKTPLTIYVPRKMADNLETFAKTMYGFEAYVHDGEYDAAKDLIVQAALTVADAPVVRHHIEDLAEQIIELERKEWNGIWARIISNFIATVRIGPFTNVIGNPPWIDWKSLPSGYREKVKALCIDRGLFSGAGRTGGINLNVCALISHVSATNWLAPGGKLSFLMPKELINQASYEGWRTAVGGENLSLIELHDWSKAGYPFDPVKEDFMTYVFIKEKQPQKSLPVYAHIKAKGKTSGKSHLWPNLDVALKLLSGEERRASQLIAGKTGYTIAQSELDLAKFEKIAGECQYIGREGIEFYPQELVIFEFDSLGPKKGTAWMTNYQVAKSKYKIPQQKILLETKFLYPLVKGPGIERLAYSDPDLYVAFPYTASDPHAPIERKELRKLSPFLLGYYEKFRSQFEQQTGYSDTIRGDGEFYGLARTGPYSFQNCYIAYRDNSKWRATVISEKDCPWGERKRFLFQNHAVSMCERSDGKLVSKTEAYFVAGIFNTPIVESYIYASSDNRSFKIRPPVYIPLFDAGNTDHMAIAQLAIEAEGQSESLRAHSLTKIESTYLKLCDLKHS